MASIAIVVKSTYMTSTTGRIPVTAAPTAMLTMPSSLIGVSRTRSGPKSSTSDLVTPNTPPPPHTATSSPITNTSGSRAISSRRPSLSACA